MPRGDFDDVEKVSLVTDSQDGALAVIDVLLPNGQKFCRVNVFAKQDGSWGDVDVVLQDGQQATACAWVNGAPELHKPLPGAKLVAVDIKQGPVVKSGPKKQERAYAAV